MPTSVGDLASLSVDVEDFALITHRVPVERVEALVPSVYDLETFEDADGRYCFVTATCFGNKHFRPTPLPFLRHTFYESTYRTYVLFNGNRGVYFFGRYLGTQRSKWGQRLLARDSWLADFDVESELTPDGYRSYVCHATGSHGETSFSIEATGRPEAQIPFESGDELTQFFTYRLEGLFTTSLGFQGHMPVSHPPMNPFSGKLSAGRFELWERLGVVPRDEANDAYSVLVQPQVRFLLHPPRPVFP